MMSSFVRQDIPKSISDSLDAAARAVRPEHRWSDPLGHLGRIRSAIESTFIEVQGEVGEGKEGEVGEGKEGEVGEGEEGEGENKDRFRAVVKVCVYVCMYVFCLRLPSPRPLVVCAWCDVT